MEPFLEQTRFPPQNAPANNETTATNDDPTNDHLQQQQQPRVTDERANEDANVTSDYDETAMTRTMKDADARWEKLKLCSMSKGMKKQPSRFDCAWCGVCQGECPGRPKHGSCSRCLIAYYCSRQCQRRHWGEGEHKLFCLSPEERTLKEGEAAIAAEEEEEARTAAATATAAKKKGASDVSEENEEGEDKCPICLVNLQNAVSICVLPCSHRFHASCIDELRSKAKVQKCPLCKAGLPKSAKEMFDEGFIFYCQVRDELEKSNGSWEKLSKTQKKKMKMAIDNMVGAAMQGHAGAQCNLGVMYYNGHGVKQSYEKAVEWYAKAAKQGHASAQCNLGFMYENGHGVKQSYEKAVEWYGKAAKQGLAGAQCCLGFMYYNGHGVKQSDSDAIRWYGMAAKQGMEIAQDEINGILTKAKERKRGVSNRESFTKK